MIFKLAFKEIAHRKMGFLMSALGVLAAVALFVFFFTAGNASRQETARLMRNLGLNLRIIPGATDMGRFWASGFSDETLPEEYVRRLASHAGLSYSHLLPTLKARVEWGGRLAVLVGVLPEVSPIGRREAPMSYEVARGEVFLGHALSEGLRPGGKVEILGKTFAVGRRLEESGTDQDISIFGHLHDVQEILGKRGMINEIQALNCLCFDARKDSLTALREQLAAALPDVKVIQIRPIAEAREKQRRMVEDYLAVILPVALVACAAWVGLLAMMNVRERRAEIGVLRALGYGSRAIAGLFLCRALLVGLSGGFLGFFLGTALALAYGPDMFQVTGSNMAPDYGLLGWSLVLAPALAAVSGLIPAAAAVVEDPAVTLREE
jgi:putative ABC transport system permease protein